MTNLNFASGPIEVAANPWAKCHYLTCSVLPVRMACNLNCKFCFSKSSISTLEQDLDGWTEGELERYFAFSRAKGASRLVVTGGGEPLLRLEAVRTALNVGRRFFSEIALFTNGVLLDRKLAGELAGSGLSYLCYSRHHDADDRNRSLMGAAAPDLEEFFSRVDGQLKIRAVCVLCRGYVESADDMRRYVDRLENYGVREFTFKHTYIAYKQSLFGGSNQNVWARQNQVQQDACDIEGEIIASLPWGPKIKTTGELKLCYYYEPTPEWELQNQTGRSLNLLADGKVYGSLEDQRSLLFTLTR
jgi:cyclic pyranopterin phosphate synthase